MFGVNAKGGYSMDLLAQDDVFRDSEKGELHQLG